MPDLKKFSCFGCAIPPPFPCPRHPPSTAESLTACSAQSIGAPPAAPSYFRRVAGAVRWYSVGSGDSRCRSPTPSSSQQRDMSTTSSTSPQMVRNSKAVGGRGFGGGSGKAADGAGPAAENHPRRRRRIRRSQDASVGSDRATRVRRVRGGKATNRQSGRAARGVREGARWSALAKLAHEGTRCASQQEGKLEGQDEQAREGVRLGSAQRGRGRARTGRSAKLGGDAAGGRSWST